MTDLRPRIFVGSSTEGLEIAKTVCNQLRSVADCTIWTRAFKFGNSTFDDLLNMLNLFDYGILIATADDLTKFRKAKVTSVRDNVIFEFGLFTGRLGKQRTFLLTEKGAKIPTDLSGITLPFFEKKTGVALKKEVKKSCDQVKEHIKSREGIYDFGFLPSTALAFGYFKNFVANTINVLSHDKRIKLNDGSVLDFKKINFKILIPSSLSSDMFKKVNATRLSKNWRPIKIEATGYRPFDFHLDMTQSKKGKIHLCDIPITLSSLNEAISFYAVQTHLGKNEAQKILENREIIAFKRVLDFLISEDPYTRGVVTTEIVDI